MDYAASQCYPCLDVTQGSETHGGESREHTCLLASVLQYNIYYMSHVSMRIIHIHNSTHIVLVMVYVWWCLCISINFPKHDDVPLHRHVLRS
jgi:hypothetical protein